MPSTSQSLADERVQEEAALWFARLRGDEVSAAEHAAFSAWMETDPRHRVEYGILERVWAASAPLKPRGTGKPRRRPMLGAAAGLAIAIAVGWLALVQSGEELATGRGERRHLRLADGSELDMAPDTRLRVKYGPELRRLDLESGRIAISVAADRQRPFAVAAGGGVIRDIGTRFEVGTDGSRTRVVVAEGAVDVALAAGGAPSWRVVAGEGLEFDERQAAPPRPQDAAAAMAWTRGQLAFDSTPLAAVVAELNQYRRKPIELADPALKHIRISGVFLIADDDAALSAIARVAPVEFHSRETKVEARFAR